MYISGTPILSSCIFGGCVSKLDRDASQEMSHIEGLETAPENPRLPNKDCYNILIRTMNGLVLYNTFQTMSDTNPMTFANLDDYAAFIETQRNTGLRCPVLFLQPENNTQGQEIYRIRPSPFSLEAGLPPMNTGIITPSDASIDNPPYNQGTYSGFDPYGQYIGVYTTLDQIHDSTALPPVSDNPMDPNWGGVLHSQQMVDSGKYDERTVGKPVMVPRVIAMQ